jgi:hypothetical protein
MDHPGMYDFNFVSEQKFQKIGFKQKPPTKEELKTLLALREAQLDVAGSLIVITTGVVHNMDEALHVQNPPEIVPGLHVFAKSTKFKKKVLNSPITLREILLSIPYPINCTDPKLPPSKRLFHSVDVNTGACNISYCSLIKFTCYRTRLPLGTAFISSLPAFINRFYGKQAAELWIPHDYSMDIANYEFHFDDSGTKWTGEWTLADDRQLEADLLVEQPDALDLDYVRPTTVKVTSTELVDKNIFQRVNETGMATTDNVSVGKKTTRSGSKRTNDDVSQCDDESLATNRTLVLGSNSDTDADSLQDDVSMAGTAVTLPGIQDTDDVLMAGTAETLPSNSGIPKNAPNDTASQASDETYKGQHPHMKNVEINEYESDDEVSKFSQVMAFTAPGANVAQAYARQNDLQDSDGETHSEQSVPHEIQGTKTRLLPINNLVNYQMEDIDKPTAGNDCQDLRDDLVRVG